MTSVVYSSTLPVTSGELFAFHLDPANLARISPPIPPFRLLSAPRPTRAGDEQVFRLGFGPLGVTWRARISRLKDGRLLEDVQESGPFRRWRHQHQVQSENGASRLTDVVSFRLVPTPLGEFVEFLLVRPAIFAMFAWRHRRTRSLLASVSDAAGKS